jgi:O-antigen/teichoic acid export membrane protein
MDSIVLGLIKGDAAVGLYSTALRIARIPFAIVGAISSVMIPLISHAYHNKDIQGVVSLASKSFSFICVAGMPIAFGMFVSANFLITSFAGKNFGSAVIILQILSPVIMVVGINNVFAIQLLYPIGQEKALFKAVFISMIFSIISNLVLISIFSFIGAAITNLLTEILVTTLSFIFVKKFVPIQLDKKIFLQCLVSSALFIPIASTIRTMQLGFVTKEVLVVIACAVFYFSYVWFFVDNQYVNSIKQSVLDKFNSRPRISIKALKPEVKTFD